MSLTMDACDSPFGAIKGALGVFFSIKDEMVDVLYMPFRIYTFWVEWKWKLFSEVYSGRVLYKLLIEQSQKMGEV